MMRPRHLMADAPGMILPLVLKGLDLTAEQEKHVHDIMKAHRATFRTRFRELQVAHKDVADKLFAPGNVQPEDLATQMQRVAQLREQLMQEGLKVALEVRGVLTAEQLTKAAEIKAWGRAIVRQGEAHATSTENSVDPQHRCGFRTIPADVGYVVPASICPGSRLCR
jgi:Spy/CpxP family protein refolding chaperone